MDVDELFVARAIDGTSLLRQPVCRLAFHPLAAINGEAFLAAVVDDNPIADHRKKLR